MAKQKQMVKKTTEAKVNSFGKNYAGDQVISERFMREVWPFVETTRSNRISLEEKWLNDHQKWSCVLDNAGYVGRSNVFVPELNDQVEQSVEKALSAIFASQDLVYAVPKKGTKKEIADKIKQAVLYEIEERNSGFTLFDEFERQKILFGTSVMKGRFEKNLQKIFTRDNQGKPIEVDVPLFWGMKWDVVDLFHWYLFPEVGSLSNNYMIFEDNLVDLLKEKQKTGVYYGLDDLSTPPDRGYNNLPHQWVDLDRRDVLSLAQVLKSRPNSAVFTEIWVNWDLIPGIIQPMQVVVANQYKPVRIVRNPLWIQRAPYVGSRYIRRPGKIYYGLSLSDKIGTQQDQINDVWNQGMDSLNYSVSPIAVIDPAIAGDVNSFKVKPGAKWLGDPRGIEFKFFPDVSSAAFRGVQELRAQVAQFSDNSPGVAPQLSGKARSATQASIIAQAVSVRQKVMLRLEEDEVLKPMCEITHSGLVQFMDKPWQIKNQGPDNGDWVEISLNPTDILGEVDWVWKGADQAEKTAVRSQQLLSFYNLALQTAVTMPGEVDLPILFKKVAKEAFDLRDMDEVFKSLRAKKTVSPEVENIALSEGDEVDTNPGDDDDAHIISHENSSEQKGLTDEAEIAHLRHIEKHKIQKQAKRAAVEMRAKLQALQASQANGGSSPQPRSDGRAGPAAPSPMEGNRAQTASSPSQIMSGMRGVQP